MRRTAIALLVACTLATGCSHKASEEDLQDRISELESENTDLQHQLDEARQAAAANDAAQANRLAAQARDDDRDEDRGDANGDAANGGDDAAQAADQAAQAANEAAAAASED